MLVSFSGTKWGPRARWVKYTYEKLMRPAVSVMVQMSLMEINRLLYACVYVFFFSYTQP